MTPPTHPRDPSPRARGSVYVLALGASTLVAIAGLTVVALTRTQGRQLDAQRDSAIASIHAQSGIEYLAAMINTSTDWRTRFISRGAIGPISIDRATITMYVVDEADNNLANDASQPVRITAVARAGQATRALSARLVPSGGVGLEILRSSAFAQSNLTISGSGSVSAGMLMSNATLANAATLSADVESTNVTSSGFINGRVTTGSSATRVLPSDAVWTTLLAAATSISYTNLSGGTLDRVLLSPARNPYGTSNPRGIYAISLTGSQTLRIRRSRLQATLLVSLVGNAQVSVIDEVNWEPGRSDQPALLVRGKGQGVELMTSSSPLSESSAGTNFNPPGSPYNALTNTTQTDIYPGEIKGIVHVMDASTPLTIGESTRLTGTAIAVGTITISPGVSLSPMPSYIASPPAGYARSSGVTMLIEPGSYRWEVDTTGLN